jgi:outer membrane protein assembly factor BamB
MTVHFVQWVWWLCVRTCVPPPPLSLVFSSASVATNWTYQSGGSASVVSANGVLFVASGEGILSAVNATTGAALWSVELGERTESSPALVNGAVIVGSDNYL